MAEIDKRKTVGHFYRVYYIQHIHTSAKKTTRIDRVAYCLLYTEKEILITIQTVW